MYWLPSGFQSRILTNYSILISSAHDRTLVEVTHIRINTPKYVLLHPKHTVCLLKLFLPTLPVADQETEQLVDTLLEVSFAIFIGSLDEVQQLYPTGVLIKLL